MRFASGFSLLLSAAPLVGQVPRLVDTVEAPIAYLCLEAMPPAAGTEPRQAGAVQRLLADPAFDTLFTSGDAAPAGPSARALALVRGVLTRSSGELELALTGIVPAAGQPLLVLRARLQGAEADRLQMALDANELATPARRLGGTTTYTLRGETAPSGPGDEVELALRGADLVVGNDSAAMREVLEPPAGRTAAGGAPRALSRDQRFTSMRQRLPVAPGAVWVYGDWRRLGQRVESSLGGVAGALMGASGLGTARAVMASLEGSQASLTATLLLEFDAGETKGERAGRPGLRGPDGRDRSGIDGWFAAVEPVAARSLLGELPAGGLGGLVLSVDLDLAAVAQCSHEGAFLLRELDQAFAERGLSFERNVRSRLGSRGTVQLHLGRGNGEPELHGVYAVRTKNNRAASELFADLRRAAEPFELGKVVEKDVRDGGRERRVVELLELRARRQGPGADPVFVAAHDDSLLLSVDSDSLATLVDELRRTGRPRAKRADAVATAIAAIGGESVAGLFDVDLQPLFAQIAAACTGRGMRVDLAALPKRHTGYLDLQRGEHGTVVRVRVVSSK